MGIQIRRFRLEPATSRATADYDGALAPTCIICINTTKMSNTRVPPEIWLQIIRLATTIPTFSPSQHVPTFSPFDLRRQEDTRNFETNYAQSLASKRSISLVCKCWRYLVFPFLWEIICLLPGRKHHAIGSTLQRYKTSIKSSLHLEERRAGEYVRAVHILEEDTGPAHELYDMANIQRIINCCPNLVTLTAPVKWQLYRRDSHLSFRPATSLREVHLSTMDEETIRGISRFPEQLLVLHGSSVEIDDGTHYEEMILPNVHTISMRLSDMDDRNIFAPSLSHWIIHDNIIGIENYRAYTRHASLVTSLELACSWGDRLSLQYALAGMTQLQELVIHIDSLCVSPVPCCLPQTVRRVGFFCPYSKHEWVLNTDAGTFRWFLDHLEDWLAIAIRAHETLELVRFLDWPAIKLPSSSLEQRRLFYSKWWSEKFDSYKSFGVKLQNQLGNSLCIDFSDSSID